MSVGVFPAQMQFNHLQVARSRQSHGAACSEHTASFVSVRPRSCGLDVMATDELQACHSSCHAACCAEFGAGLPATLRKPARMNVR